MYAPALADGQVDHLSGARRQRNRHSQGQDGQRDCANRRPVPRGSAADRRRGCSHRIENKARSNHGTKLDVTWLQSAT
jgi:hypothetical protein